LKPDSDNIAVTTDPINGFPDPNDLRQIAALDRSMKRLNLSTIPK
jgi:hypothetical protein